ncbi:phospholipase D family protein [Parvibaculum sp. MBR-TMA-1.3b-4.2]|jgi:hypothetical protein
MKEATVLYSSSRIHKEIKRIFSQPQPNERRVALVAYVSDGAEKYLPNVDGLEVICCLEPGATSANALGRLRDRGAVVRKSERLHAKVYWSSRKGCVICSANLSSNALGKDGTKEAGVFFEPGIVDIEKFIQETRPRTISDGDLETLNHQSKVLGVARGVSAKKAKRRAVSFSDWYEASFREPWKLGWSSDEGGVSEAAVIEAKNIYGVRQPQNHINVDEDQVSSGDWLLCFSLPEGEEVEWMYVDFVVPVSLDDEDAYEKDYPFQAVQAHKLLFYPTPPFQINRGFQVALQSALEKHGSSKIERQKSLKPSKAFLELINREFKAR